MLSDGGKVVGVGGGAGLGVVVEVWGGAGDGDGDVRGVRELDGGGGGGDGGLVGDAVDAGAAVVLAGAADVSVTTALSAIGRRRIIVVAAGTRDRYVVEPRVEVSGSAVVPTMGSQALDPMGWPSCWMTVERVFR